MKALKIQLRREVYKNDARLIMHWLQDNDVIKFLNENKYVTESIKQVINRVNIPVVTHLFNQNGLFFIVATQKDDPVGFLRLVPKQTGVEMVVVIGDKEKWGQGLGSHAIQKGLDHAFFEWRAKKVVAKIHSKNERSIRVFNKVGFKFEKNLPAEKQYSISMDEFLKLA